MNVPLDEAIRIYAHVSRRWFGSSAVKKTEDQIERLRRSGDAEGVRVWEQVQHAIVALDEPETTENLEQRHIA